MSWHICLCRHDIQQQSLTIDNEVMFTSLDLFAPVIAIDGVVAKLPHTPIDWRDLTG